MRRPLPLGVTWLFVLLVAAAHLTLSTPFLPMPPHLAALLLQTSLTPGELWTFGTVLFLGLVWLVSSAGNLEKIFGWLTAGRRAKEQAAEVRFTEIEASLEKLKAGFAPFVGRDELEKRFAGIEEAHRIVAAETLNQHNTLMEYLRERERLAAGFRADITQLQRETHALEPMPGRVISLENKLDNLTSQINDVKADIRNNKQELKEDMRANKSEIIAAIKANRG